MKTLITLIIGLACLMQAEAADNTIISRGGADIIVAKEIPWVVYDIGTSNRAILGGCITVTNANEIAWGGCDGKPIYRCALKPNEARDLIATFSPNGVPQIVLAKHPETGNTNGFVKIHTTEFEVVKRTKGKEGACVVHSLALVRVKKK